MPGFFIGGIDGCVNGGEVVIPSTGHVADGPVVWDGLGSAATTPVWVTGQLAELAMTQPRCASACHASAWGMSASRADRPIGIRGNGLKAHNDDSIAWRHAV
jgi:hypothetical protein